MTFEEFALSDQPAEREKRIKKAASAECTPVSVSREEQSGEFSGSSGVYHTWVGECECVDFRRRGLPCKHMYRLAHELGLYDLGTVKADASKIKRKVTPKERAAAYDACVALIEGYPEETQQALREVLYDRYKANRQDGNGPTGGFHVCWNAAAVALLERPLADGLLEAVEQPALFVERNTQKATVDGLLAAGFSFPPEAGTTKKARYLWCIEHPEAARSMVYADGQVVRPAGQLEVAYMKVYTYLNSLFEDEGF